MSAAGQNGVLSAKQAFALTKKQASYTIKAIKRGIAPLHFALGPRKAKGVKDAKK